MICRISILNDSKLNMTRWTSCITLTSRYKVLSFGDVQVFLVFDYSLVHISPIWPAKLRFSSMQTHSNFICSAFLTSWLSMFKVLSSFSPSIFLGLTVTDWNFSGLAKESCFYTKTTLSGPVFWASILQSRESRQLHTADGIKFVEASSLTNLVPRALFPGFRKAPWGR